MLLGLGRRQVDRVLAGYRQRGVGSVIHGNRGRVPANKLNPDVARTVVSLLDKGGKYHGFNVCHACDVLLEKEGISMGRSTLDRLLREAKIVKSGSRRKQVRRKRRERASAEGMMLQIDGSPHDWLECRGPRMSLVGAIDDATGKVIHGMFRPTEDLAGYLVMLRKIATSHGIPESVYHDRHTILRSPKPATIEDELAGARPVSQFQRVLDELGISSIPASSPQAKGRVERLWGVLQDRLVKEMRLEGISAIEDANAFLPGFIRRYNRRFAVRAAEPESAWVKMEPRTDLAYYFCTKESRVVRSDHTISWYGRTLQILPGSRDRCLAGASVNVHVTPENDVFIYDGKRRLDYRSVLSVAKRRPSGASVHPKRKQPDAEGLARRRAWLFAEPVARHPAAPLAQAE
jgi:hypothetical protein